MTARLSTPDAADVAAGRAHARPAAQRWQAARQGAPWALMMVPAIVLLAVLIGYPFIRAIALSFQSTALGLPSTWTGLRNYQDLIHDPLFWKAVQVTLEYTALALIAELLLAWTLALLLWNLLSRLGNVLRVFFAIPLMLSPVVVGVAWRVLLNPQTGWIDAIFHTPTLAWLGSPRSALLSLVLVNVWQWMPFMFLIIAAGLTGIRGDILEAARVDGAGGLLLFRRIILPMTLPVTIVAILFQLLDTLKSFDLPYNLTSGGPGNSTETVALYIYQEAFENYRQGYASAVALFCTIGMAILASLLLYLLRRSERRLI